MRALRSMHPPVLSCLAFATGALCGTQVSAQQIDAAPGHFDYYVLNLSSSADFCHNLEVLPPSERAPHDSPGALAACKAPRGFALHGLWPQNFNGTWPANCSDGAGPGSYAPFLRDTPSIALLQHEWNKHGTCSGLSPVTFFQSADRAFHQVRIPRPLQTVTTALSIETGALLRAFYQANPSYPRGSILLACRQNRLTAVNVCLSKQSLQPIACQQVQACDARTLTVPADGALQHD